MRYAECETVEAVEAINLTYWEDGGSGDMEGGCWLYQLPSLKNGDNMFSATNPKLAATYNGRISLWKFVGNLQSLESGIDMFAGCALDYESVCRISDTLPAVTTGNITIGIDHTLETDKATQEALDVIEGKGWTVTAEYNNYNLPYKFTELDYLETSGTQHIRIDDLFAANNDTARIVFDASDSSDGTQILFGSRQSWKLQALSVSVAKTSSSYAQFGKQAQPFDFSQLFNTKAEIVISQSGCLVNNARVASFDNEVFTSPSPYYLFTTITSGSVDSRKLIGKCYAFSIKRNGEMLRNFVPVLNTDGVPGMWDSINNRFYDNDGGGTFGYRITSTGGTVAPTPMSLRDPYYTAPSGIYARLVAENELDVIADTDMEADAAEQNGYTWFPNTGEAYEHFGITLTEEEVIDV